MNINIQELETSVTATVHQLGEGFHNVIQQTSDAEKAAEALIVLLGWNHGKQLVQIVQGKTAQVEDNIARVLGTTESALETLQGLTPKALAGVALPVSAALVQRIEAAILKAEQLDLQGGIVGFLQKHHQVVKNVDVILHDVTSVTGIVDHLPFVTSIGFAAFLPVIDNALRTIEAYLESIPAGTKTPPPSEA